MPKHRTALQFALLDIDEGWTGEHVDDCWVLRNKEPGLRKAHERNVLIFRHYVELLLRSLREEPPPPIRAVRVDDESLILFPWHRQDWPSLNEVLQKGAPSCARSFVKS